MAGDLTPEELVRDYLEPVHRFAAMLCPSASDRDDVAQEALVKAILRRHQYDPAKGELRAWLWRIVANVAKDHGRRAGRAGALWDRMFSVVNPDAADDSAESVALQRIESDDLLAAIHRLPERHRMVVALRFGAGLPHREIAEALGISEGASTQTLHRALGKLRRSLEEAERQSERTFLEEARG